MKCRWMGSYMQAETALMLSRSGTQCPNCREPLVVHFNSDEEERRFEGAVAASAS